MLKRKFQYFFKGLYLSPFVCLSVCRPIFWCQSNYHFQNSQKSPCNWLMSVGLLSGTGRLSLFSREFRFQLRAKCTRNTTDLHSRTGPRICSAGSRCNRPGSTRPLPIYKKVYIIIRAFLVYSFQQENLDEEYPYPLLPINKKRVFDNKAILVYSFLQEKNIDEEYPSTPY